MHEQLISIKSGKFNEPSLETYAFDTFQAMDEVEEFFEDYTFKIDEATKVKGAKNVSRKNRKHKKKGG